MNNYCLSGTAAYSFRALFKEIRDELEPKPIEMEITDGVYLGYYVQSQDTEVTFGTLYVYIADPAQFCDGSLPDNLRSINSPIRSILDEIRSINSEVADFSEINLELDESSGNGGVYFTHKLMKNEKLQEKNESQS